MSTVKYDKHGNLSYYEKDNGDWVKWVRDEHGFPLSSQYSNGFWCKFKYEYGHPGKHTHYIDSAGYVEKRKYDSRGNCALIQKSHDDDEWECTLMNDFG